MPQKRWIDFTAVREAVPFSEVLAHYDIAIPSGKTQFKISCPFHGDATPSCSINLDGKFKCFGCTAQGTQIDFIILMEGGDPANDEDRYRAHEIAIALSGRSITDFTRRSNRWNKEARKPKQEAKSEQNASEAESKSNSATIPDKNPVFDRELKLSSDHAFLKDRGIDPALAERYGIGFCEKGIMKDRIAIPIHNAQGKLVAYVGRWAKDEVPENIARYKFPKNFHKSLELWNLHRASQLEKKYLVLVEGYWSAIRLHEMGVPCVALMGTSLSEAQINLIKESGFKFVIQLMDGDDAGLEASVANAPVLSRHFYVRTTILPEGDKPDNVPEKFLRQLV